MRGAWDEQSTAGIAAHLALTLATEPERKLPLKPKDNLSNVLARYVMAVVAVGVAYGVRLAIEALAGRGLPTYITFYPAVMLVALLWGFGPGFLSTFLSALLAAFWLLEPRGSFAVAIPIDAVGLAFFSGMGIFMSVVAGLYRRTRDRLQDLVAQRTSELARANEWLRVTLTSIGDAVLAADNQAKISFLNPVAQKLTGWEEGEALGRPIQDVFRIVDERTHQSGEDIAGRVLREGKVVVLANHTALVTRQGREIPIEDSAAPITDAAGKVTGVVLVFHDVTEKRRAQQALAQGEQRVRAKLESILSPEGDIETLDLADLIDAPAMQSMLEDFYRLARIPVSIMDLKGRMLAGVGWQEICTNFHRANPQTCRHCLESDTVLTQGVEPGQFKLYKCKNRMWDVVTPIMLRDRHVGNLFSGQFFFDDEQVDREEFLAQARQFGFDEKPYLEALDRVPRLSREAINTGMAFFMKLAHTLSQTSFSNLKLARLLAEREALMTSLQESQAELLRLNQTLRAMSNSSQAIVRALDELQYLQEVCRIIAEDCGYSMVWIGYAQEDEGKSIVPVAHAGFEEGYLETLQPTWADTPRGHGPTGTAIRTGQVAMCRNMLTDERFAPWREQAIKRGYASSIVLPLRSEGRVFGALTIYSPRSDPFSPAEVSLLTSLADDLAYGITVLRLREAHGKAEDSLRQSEAVLRRTVEELSRSNNELEQFAYITSHDLQEPLRQVSGFVQLLKSRYGENLDEQASQFMRFIVDGAARMSTLIKDLLSFSRVGARDVRRQKVQCQHALEGALANLRSTIEEAGAQLTHDELPAVVADPTRLTQLFQNLLSNAIKFRRDGVTPQIHVGCRGEGRQWVFCVRDNGIGIDVQYHQKVFLIFQRLHSRDKYPGTGIGLAICKKIVEQHGGRIWIEPTPPPGTTFCFTLPREQPAEA